MTSLTSTNPLTTHSLANGNFLGPLVTDASIQKVSSPCRRQPLIKPLLSYNDWLFGSLPKSKIGKCWSVAWRIVAFIITAPLVYPLLSALAFLGLPFVKRNKKQVTPVLGPTSNTGNGTLANSTSPSGGGSVPNSTVNPPSTTNPVIGNPPQTNTPPANQAVQRPIPPPPAPRIPAIQLATPQERLDKIRACFNALWPSVRQIVHANPQDRRQFRMFCDFSIGQTKLFHDVLGVQNADKTRTVCREDCLSSMEDIRSGLATSINALEAAPPAPVTFRLLIVEQSADGRFSYFTASNIIGAARNRHTPNISISDKLELQESTSQTVAGKITELAYELRLEGLAQLDADGFFVEVT